MCGDVTMWSQDIVRGMLSCPTEMSCLSSVGETESHD